MLRRGERDLDRLRLLDRCEELPRLRERRRDRDLLLPLRLLGLLGRREPERAQERERERDRREEDLDLRCRRFDRDRKRAREFDFDLERGRCLLLAESEADFEGAEFGLAEEFECEASFAETASKFDFAGLAARGLLGDRLRLRANGEVPRGGGDGLQREMP